MEKLKIKSPKTPKHGIFLSSLVLAKNLAKLLSTIEYRITDVTALDNDNQFWGINYFWPGDKNLLTPGTDKLLKIIDKGRSHSKYDQVERLVEFKMDANGISISDTEPIQLLLESDASRNWEAIARLDDKGLLIATDKHPRMIFGYVPFN